MENLACLRIFLSQCLQTVVLRKQQPAVKTMKGIVLLDRDYLRIRLHLALSGPVDPKLGHVSRNNQQLSTKSPPPCFHGRFLQVSSEFFRSASLSSDSYDCGESVQRSQEKQASERTVQGTHVPAESSGPTTAAASWCIRQIQGGSDTLQLSQLPGVQVGALTSQGINQEPRRHSTETAAVARLHHGSPCLLDQYLTPRLISIGFFTEEEWGQKKS